jgi:hypothetical protein
VDPQVALAVVEDAEAGVFGLTLEALVTGWIITSARNSSGSMISRCW